MRTRKGRQTALAVAAAGYLFLGAAAAQAAEITVGDATIGTNSEGFVTVTLNLDEGDAVAGTLNDITFEPDARIPGIMGMTVVTTLAEAIPAGELTTVTVTDAVELPSFGTITVEGEEISYSAKDDATGVLTVASRGDDSVTHDAGAEVEIPTALPDCQMTEELANLPDPKEAVFSFLPDGCDPESDCDTVRGIVIALDNLGEIPDGTPLYTCTIATGDNEGDYDLGCPEAQASTPPDGEGNVMQVDTTCNPGVVTVGVQLIGDCDNSGEVSLGEVQISFNIFLGDAPLSSCPAASSDGEEVSLGDVQTAFNNFLGS
jgi:hypothetical protein